VPQDVLCAVVQVVNAFVVLLSATHPVSHRLAVHHSLRSLVVGESAELDAVLLLGGE
jgi:hypothetical protein